MQTSIIMTNQEGREFVGRAEHSRGKDTTVKLHQSNLLGNVERVRVVGREELTTSERARDEFVLHVLQGRWSMINSRFIRLLWFPSPVNPRKTGVCLASTHLSSKHLNESQRTVIGAMIADDLPLVIAHGKLQHTQLE